MDYEKKYRDLVEAIKKLQEANPSDEGIQKWVEDNVPELAKSEDERIREKVIATIHLYYGEPLEDEAKEMIYWLEKQGEMDIEAYKAAEDKKREFVGDGFIKCYANFQDFKEGETYWLEYVGNDNYNVRSDNLLGKTYHITPCQLYTIFKKQTWLEKQGEQKPAEWSKEDERNFDIIYGIIYNSCIAEDASRLIEWLKSLKDRHTWKPSDEQLVALRVAIGDEQGSDCCDILRSLLKDLSNRFKAHKGE